MRGLYTLAFITVGSIIDLLVLPRLIAALACLASSLHEHIEG